MAPRPAAHHAPAGRVTFAGGQCLTDPGGSARAGTVITAARCSAGPAQAWTFGADGTVRVHGPAGECLTAVQEVGSFGAKVPDAVVLGGCASPPARWLVLGGRMLENLGPGVIPGCLIAGQERVTVGACGKDATLALPARA